MTTMALQVDEPVQRKSVDDREVCRVTGGTGNAANRFHHLELVPFLVVLHLEMMS